MLFIKALFLQLCGDEGSCNDSSAHFNIVLLMHKSVKPLRVIAKCDDVCDLFEADRLALSHQIASKSVS